MNQESFSDTLELRTKRDLDQLENRLQGKLGGRVQNLRLDLRDSSIVLRGYAHTYYAKQLAQHAVMSETDVPILANEIEVG